VGFGERRADFVDRVQKLKDARSEAAKEIEEYKAKKEAEYKKFESEVCLYIHIYGAIGDEGIGLEMDAKEYDGGQTVDNL
jgi:hypothetical protein